MVDLAIFSRDLHSSVDIEACRALCRMASKDITLGWKRKPEFTVQSNGKVGLGNYGRYYLRVK